MGKLSVRYEFTARIGTRTSDWFICGSTPAWFSRRLTLLNSVVTDESFHPPYKKSTASLRISFAA